MKMQNDYTLVVDDSLNGFKDAFIDDSQQQIMVSPAIFSLLQDADSRAIVLDQIAGYRLDFFNKIKTVLAPSPKINTKDLGKWS